MKELKVREFKWFGVMAKPGFKLRAAQLQRTGALFATPTLILISLSLSHFQCNYKVKWRTEWFLRTMTTLKVTNSSLPTTFLKTCVSACCFSVALLTRLDITRFVYKYLVLIFWKSKWPSWQGPSNFWWKSVNFLTALPVSLPPSPLDTPESLEISRIGVFRLSLPCLIAFHGSPIGDRIKSKLLTWYTRPL